MITSTATAIGMATLLRITSRYCRRYHGFPCSKSEAGGFQIAALQIHRWLPLTSRIQFMTSASSGERAISYDCLRASAMNFLRHTRSI